MCRSATPVTITENPIPAQTAIKSAILPQSLCSLFYMTCRRLLTISVKDRLIAGEINPAPSATPALSALILEAAGYIRVMTSVLIFPKIMAGPLRVTRPRDKPPPAPLALTEADTLKLHASIAVGRRGVDQAYPPVRTGAVSCRSGASRIRLGSGSRIRLGRDGMQRAAVVSTKRRKPRQSCAPGTSGVMLVKLGQNI